MYTYYVAGLTFDTNRENVALIRKNKPDWQKGKLNGIGGKVENGESSVAAMVREFKEETGFLTEAEDWYHFMTFNGIDFAVDFYLSEGDLTKLSSTEEEKIEIVSLRDIQLNKVNMVENLSWSIGIALDYLEDGRPDFVEVHYP